MSMLVSWVERPDSQMDTSVLEKHTDAILSPREEGEIFI